MARFIMSNGEICIASLDENLLTCYPLEFVLNLADQDNLKGHPRLDISENLVADVHLKGAKLRFIQRTLVEPDTNLIDPTENGLVLPKWLLTFHYHQQFSNFDPKSGKTGKKDYSRLSRVRTSKVKKMVTEDEWKFLWMYCNFTFEGLDYLRELMGGAGIDEEVQSATIKKPKQKAKVRRMNARVRSGSELV